jgi:hypothetical protein
VFSPLHAYFLPTHENGELSVLGKLPYMLYFIHSKVNTCIIALYFCQRMNHDAHLARIGSIYLVIIVLAQF